MTLLPGVLELAAGQHGLVARWQLVASEIPRSMIDGWRRRGLLVRVHRGVYRIPGAPQTSQQACMAAVLRCGEDARADGWASCWLHKLEGFESSVGVVLPAPRQVTGVRFSTRSTLLEPADLQTVQGIPALSAARAIIEVAPTLSEKRLRVSIDSARRLRLLSIDWLEQRAVALRGLHGARIVLRVINSRALDQESEGERELAQLLWDFEGLEWGVTDVVPGRRLDCFIRDALLVPEYDGRDHHVLPTDRDKDGLRELEIRSVYIDGFPLEPIRITKGMIRDAPEATREFVRRRREERRAEIAAARERNTELRPPARAKP